MKTFFISIISTIFSVGFFSAQVGIGVSNPNSNSILDVSSTSKGLLLPRVTLTSIISASPLAAHVAGMIVYNTATAGISPNNVSPGLYINDGTQWNILGGNTTSATTLGVVGGCNGISYIPNGSASTAPSTYIFNQTVGTVTTSAVLSKINTFTYNGHSYAQYSVTSNGVTAVNRSWDFLQKVAQQLGGYLVVPTTKVENDAIIAFLNLAGNALQLNHEVPVGWRKSANQNERYVPHMPITCERVEYDTPNTNPFSFINPWDSAQPDYSANCNYYRTNNLWDDEQCSTDRYRKILVEYNQ